MSWNRTASLTFLTVAVAFLWVGPASAGEKVIRIKDHINHAWSNELLNYSLTFEPGQCHASTVKLLGPDGPVPCQLSEVKTDNAGFVTAARLSFVTSLPALGEKTFTLRYAAEPAETMPAPATDLNVKKERGFVAFNTSGAGVNLLAGSRRFNRPMPASEVPGPIISFRTLDGKRIGGSTLYGKRKISSYAARLEAAGPVFAQQRITYTYANGEKLVVTVRVVSNQNAVFFETYSSAHRPDDGWRLNLTRGYPNPILMARGMHAPHPRWKIPRGTIGDVPLDKEPAGLLCTVVPWMHQAGATGSKEVFALRSPAGDTAMSVGSYDPAAWVDPSWRGRRGLPEFSKMLWDYKTLPLIKGKDGSLQVDSTAALGQRKWFVGFVPKRKDPVQTYLDAASLRDSKYGCQTLDIVKDYVLEWDRGPEAYWPRLYFSREDAPAAREELGSAKRLETSTRRRYRGEDGKPLTLEGRKLIQHMVNSAYMTPRYNMTLENNYNEFDILRHSAMVIHLFDALMGTGGLSAQEEKLLRAQIAFLGYMLHSPYIYDESRGYALGGNMHLSYISSRGLVACAIPDHPMAGDWATRALEVMNERMDSMIGENGVWVTENMHYANCSLSAVLPFYMAMRNAGFYDFLKNEKMRGWVMYIVKQLTPRDPRYENTRSQPPEHMRYRAFRTALAGVMAKATARSYPEYSKVLQWAWNEQGNVESIPDSRFGVFESLLTDKSLPARKPDWRSERFPRAGVILRHGLGTQDEYYMTLPLCRFGDYYQPQPGGVTIYGKGEPLALIFSGVYEVYTAEAILTNSVSMARTPANSRKAGLKGYVGDGKISAFSAMPRQDYVLARFNLNRPYTKMPDKLPALPKWPPILKEAVDGHLRWKRQVLFVKGENAAEPSYFVFRDTTGGGQPTVWSMWTLSETLDTPERLKDISAALQSAPGNKPLDARKLGGDRFTALGQFDVDVEYYVALPRNTPRATVRWGYSTTTHWPNPWHEYQDLLHLQRRTDGDYFVAFYPRRRNDPAPAFETLAGGLVIKVTHEFGADYAFLAPNTKPAGADNAGFKGVSGSIQDRKNGLVLALGAGGEVVYKGYRLSSQKAVSICVAEAAVILSTSWDRKGGQTVMLSVPPGHAVTCRTEGVIVKTRGDAFEIGLPEGVTTAVLALIAK